MNSCRIASIFAFGSLFVAGLVEACGGDLPKADTSPVPAGLSPDAALPPQVVESDAAIDPSGIDVQFVQGRVHLTGPACSRIFLVAIQGKATAPNEQLMPGDVMIVKYPDPMYVDVDGLALRVMQPFKCQLLDKPGPEQTVRRASTSRELSWAKGQMTAHLDVGSDVSPELYLGRLEGTAPVTEHKHDGSTEILAAISASGTVTINGTPRKVGPHDVVVIPKGAVHAWTPDPGSKLIAIQIYAPPGPEQRFSQLESDDKDSGINMHERLKDGGFAICSPPWKLDDKQRHVYKTECLENGSRKPANVPAEAWDPFTHTDTRVPDGGKPDCNTPYTIDATGQKHYKAECLNMK